VAIVSPHAGTTRDVIEVQLDLDGYPVTVIDTAGIRDTDDPVEQEGVRRAKARAADADLVLWLVDADDEAAVPAEAGRDVWIVRNKIDLGRGEGGSGACDFVAANRWRNLDGASVDRNPDEGGGARFAISAAQGDGVQALVVRIARFAHDYFGGGESALIGRQRHRDLLRNTADMLRCSMDSVTLGEEVVAEELRVAVQYLGQLLGRVDVEDLLDVIFREFCVGN
jgi:tRNA modification GTPase